MRICLSLCGLYSVLNEPQLYAVSLFSIHWGQGVAFSLLLVLPLAVHMPQLHDHKRQRSRARKPAEWPLMESSAAAAAQCEAVTAAVFTIWREKAEHKSQPEDFKYYYLPYYRHTVDGFEFLLINMSWSGLCYSQLGFCFFECYPSLFFLVSANLFKEN